MLETCFHPDRYSNDWNRRAHYETTAPELWEQARDAITHLVAGLGITGTYAKASD